MAIELRCPDCRAKLRLPAAPEAGTEVECPKCGSAFPAPEPEADEEAPKKKKAAESPKQNETEKKDKKDKKGAKGANPNAPRKRKAKKRETSSVALIGVIAAGVFMVLFMTGVLIWYFTRTSKAVEMLYYAPEDAQSAMGMNLGHAQKYPAFYKSVKQMLDGHDFKIIGDAIAKAAGTDMDTLVEHFVKAMSKRNGWSIIYRTKEPFDDSSLSKLPSAEKKTLDGKTYYSVPNLLPGQTGLVFAPTNRLIVVCPGSMESQPAFRKIINGHADNRTNTLGVRMGALGQRTTRGTFWRMIVFDNELKVEAPPKQENAKSDDSKSQLAQTIFDTLNGSQGFGLKASVGSREIRFELVVWYKDSTKASEVSKKWKESDLGKGDEGNPPRWFKEETGALGDKKIGAQFLSNIGFGSSGDLYFAKTYVETTDLQQSAAQVLSKVVGLERKQGGGPMQGPGGPGMQGPGGPMPGGQGPPGGPMPGPGMPSGPMPGKPRRRSGTRR